eukprot:gene6301-7552_t
MAFMCYLDRSNVAFAALEMNAALKISDAEYGTGASSFFLGYALCGVPSSLLVIRVGIARGLALVLIIWGATSALFALCDSAFAFLALRFVLGIAESGFFPSLLAYLTLWFTEGEIGHAYTLGACSATAVAGILGGPFAAAAMYLLDNCLGLPGFASINSLGNLGGLCGPYLLGAIKQHTGSFAAGMAVLAVLQLLAGLLALAMPGKAPPASYSQLTEMTMVSADGVSETTNYSARCSEMQDNSTCSDPQI